MRTEDEIFGDHSDFFKKSSQKTDDFNLLDNFMEYLHPIKGTQVDDERNIHEYLNSPTWLVFRKYAIEEKNMIEEIAPLLESIRNSHDKIRSIIDKEKK